MNKLISIVMILLCLASESFSEDSMSFKDVVNEEANSGFIFSLTNFSEFDVSYSVRHAIYDNIVLGFSAASLRFVRDGSDYRIGLFPSVVTTGSFLVGLACSPGKPVDSTIANVFVYILATPIVLLNPSVELFVFNGRFPLSLEIGYNMDWFIFSSRKKFYFKPHADLNASIRLSSLWIRCSGSFAYLVKNTYDAKKGPRFEFRIGFGVL